MIIIGEKINGSIPSVAKAIEAHDEAFLRDLAVRQEEAIGEADGFIDVCASVPPEVEFDTMRWMLDLVQDAVDTPISVDSPNAECLAQLLPYVKKPGLVNSVSGEGNKMDIVFPVIADTKWGCVALLSDDSGIPSDAEGRLEVFHKIMDKAKEYGIAPDRLYIDPLVETLGANPESMLVFNECVRAIKEEYPTIHITSGLSNISFGLPVRKMINIPFMVLAMAAGMDSAIMDPTSRDMNGVLHATEALLGEDEFCMEYLEAYRDNLFGPIDRD